MSSSNGIGHPSHKGKCIICPEPSCNKPLERNEEAKLHIISHFPYLLVDCLWLYYFNFCKMCKHYTIQKANLKQHMWNIHKQETLDPKYTGLGGNDFTMGPNRIPASWADPNPRIVGLYRENSALPRQDMRPSNSRNNTAPCGTSVNHVTVIMPQPVWNTISAPTRSRTFPLAPGSVSSDSSLSGVLGPSPLHPIHNVNRQSSDGSFQSTMTDAMSVGSFSQISFSSSSSEAPSVSDVAVPERFSAFMPQGTAFVEEPLENSSFPMINFDIPPQSLYDTDYLGGVSVKVSYERLGFDSKIFSTPESPPSDEERWSYFESAQPLNSSVPLHNASQEDKTAENMFVRYIDQNMTS